MFSPIYTLTATTTAGTLINPDELPGDAITAVTLQRQRSEHATPVTMTYETARDLNLDYLTSLFIHFGDKPTELATALIEWLELQDFEADQLDALTDGMGYDPNDLLQPRELLLEHEGKIIGDPDQYALDLLTQEILRASTMDEAEALALALTDKNDREHWLTEGGEYSVHPNGLGVCWL